MPRKNNEKRYAKVIDSLISKNRLSQSEVHTRFKAETKKLTNMRKKRKGGDSIAENAQ